MNALRELWPGGPVTSAIGLGTWALGGPASAAGRPVGWGSSWDRAGAAAVIDAAFEAGIRLFDTSDAYGAGTAEHLLGEVLGARRDQVTLVSKWGNVIDEAAGELTGQDATPGYIRTALAASLRRLRSDHLDLYLLHLSGLPRAEADDLLGELVDLVHEGTIRGFGWSTDDPDLAAAWVGRPGFHAVEFEANVVRDAPDLVWLCERNGVAGLVRGPLGTGLLAGGHPPGSRITDEAAHPDWRGRRHSPDWLPYFRDGHPDPALGERLQQVSDVLTSGGRTLAQGALAWVWARSPALVPIPGARTLAQVRQNAATLEQGPLSAAQMAEIATLLGDAAP